MTFGPARGRICGVRTIAVVVFDDFQLLDMAGPADVFDAADKLTGGAYKVMVTAARGRAARASNGVRVALDAQLANVSNVDTLMVAGGWGSEAASKDAALLHEVRRLAATARRVTSVCSGAFVLAAAGLLDGRRATTHWAFCAELQRRHPNATIEADRIFVRDGAVATSAGVTAGMDLALALVEEDHGPEVARTVARWLVLAAQRPGGQSQFSERLEHAVPADSPVRSLVDAIVAQPSADHSVPTLAQRAALSERHLGRLFAEHTGTTPGRFVERVRVEAARDLLERSALPVEAIAADVGFGSAETMRRAFLRVLDVNPASYRARFGSAQAATAA
jgi:transcriptional regulator GlxA family with amidase domain